METDELESAWLNLLKLIFPLKAKALEPNQEIQDYHYFSKTIKSRPKMVQRCNHNWHQLLLVNVILNMSF